MSLDLFSREVITTVVSGVQSTSPFASLEYPRTELAVSSFSIAGSFSWNAPGLNPWFSSWLSRPAL